MLKKVITSILIILSISSLFLPYQEYKSMWADFDVSGSLVNSNFSVDDSFTQNKTNSGYELITPIIPVTLFILGNIFLGFIQTNSSKIVSIVLISLSVLLIIYLHPSIGSPVDAAPNTLFRPPVPIVGTGYYLLLSTATVSFFYSILNFKR